MSLVVVFSAVGLLAFAARGEGKIAGGGGGSGLKKEMKRGGMSAALTLVAKFVAKDVGLEGEKADKFVAAFPADREAAMKRFTEARKSKDREEAKKVRAESEESLDKVLADNLTAEQAKKAKAYDLEPLGRSVALVLSAQTDTAKVEQAVPVLAKYHQAVMELTTKARAKEISKRDIPEKEKELRANTAKELGPIIGDEAAKKWQGSEKLGKGDKTDKSGKAGKRGAGGDETATPVAPVAP